MDRILHDVNNAHKILQLTADTLILVDKNGTCLDIDPHSDLWFLQEDKLLGKICSICFPTIPSRNCCRTSAG